MGESEPDRRSQRSPSVGARSSRIPGDSWWFRRGLPLLLAAMGALTLGLILVAAGVLLGVVPWR